MQTAAIARARKARRNVPVFSRMSFANKNLVSTLGLLLLLGVGGALVFRWALSERMNDEVASGARVLAASLAAQAAPMVDTGDTSGLRTLAQEARRLDPDIGYALVVDRAGGVLAHTFSWDPPAAVLTAGNSGGHLADDGYRAVDWDGRAHLEVSAPIVSGVRGVGAVRLGVTNARSNRAVASLAWGFALCVGALTIIGVLAARAFLRYVTRPVVELTHLADQVSVGNLDVDFDFGVHVKCWEIKKCEKTSCLAYENATVQCWFVDGTPCEGYESRFPAKLIGCRSCDVYRAHKGDEIVQLADSFRHMTQQLRSSRRELERATRYRQSLIDNCFDGIIATNHAGTVQVFNRVAEQLTGFPGDELVGKWRCDQLFAPGVQEQLREQLARDETHGGFGFYKRELALRTRDGGTIAVRGSAVGLCDGDERLGRVFFFQDRREINRLREDLIQQERLAATGRTVASISHSVKNILEGLRGGVYVYRRGLRIEDPAVRTEGWEMVERNIDQISALVADLLNYSKERKPDLRACDANELAHDVVTSLRPKAEAAGTVLECAAGPDSATWCFDPHAMHQCLTNLVTNALDATEKVEGGRVTVSVAVSDGAHLELAVSDNGPGVPATIVRDLFSSMVTTKGARGTGLGLLVVHKVVTEHSGSVHVDTNGPGATFRVRIPRLET